MMHFINHSFIPFRFIPHFQLFVLIPDSWRLTDDRGWGFAAMVSFELASFLSSNPENDEISDRQVCKHWLALWFQTSFKRVAMEMQIMQLLWCQRLLLQRFRGSGPRRVRSMWRERRTVAELYVSVICVAPLERYMYWLFRIQREQAWLSQTVAKRPLMQLTSMSRSPVASALSETTDVLCRFSPAGSSLLGHLEGSWAGIISQQTIWIK